MSASVLVVEDEPDIRKLIVLHLERDGLRCTTAGTGDEALAAVRTHAPDLVILDLMLPAMNGLEVCRRLRSDPRWAAIPIIMLTAKSDEVDRVVGLEMGADDYVVKPFSPKELVARVHAVLRRALPRSAPTRITAGGIVLDIDRHQVEVDGETVPLTPREFALLRALLESPGRVLSREQLLFKAWGHARADDIESRTVDVHVRRLRAKLGREERRIVTVKGVGYQLDVD